MRSEAAHRVRIAIGFGWPRSRQNWSVEYRLNRWTQKIKQQCTCDAETNSASQEVAPEEIDQVAQNLSCNNRGGQFPSPKPVFEPTRSRKGQDDAEQKKKNSGGLAKTCKLPMSSGIENPYAIKGRAGPG
jgi:hypothetical protein